jgi:hypothetical protein
MIGFQKIQEIYQKPEYKDLRAHIKSDRDKGYYQYDEANIYGIGHDQQNRKIPKLKKADMKAIAETVKNIPFPMLAREFLAQSGTAGIGGAYYLVPTKIYQILQTYASPRDIINDVSMTVIPAGEIPGSTLDIDIAKGGSYLPHKTTSGAKAPEEELGFSKATLDFTNTETINFNIGNDLIEDTPQLNLIETHIRMAGAECGKRSSTLVLAVMATSNDGDGTLNAEAAGADTTTAQDLQNAIQMVLVDEFIPDTLLAPSHVVWDAIVADTTFIDTGQGDDIRVPYLKGGDGGLFAVKWVRVEHPSLWTEASDLPTNCISYVFAKDYAYISGRKRWMRIENYSDPLRDLVGAVISFRQDTVSIYNDSITKISEA